MKIPTDPKDINALREFLNTIKTQVCSLADCLSEPWKTHFNSLKQHYDEALKALPPTDQVPAAIEANHHLSAFYSCLANANALASMLGSAMDSMLKKNAETVAAQLASAVGAEMEKQIQAGTLFKAEAMEKKVAEAIEAKTKAGELVPKELHSQLCSAAKDQGAADGEKKVRDEIASAEARKTLIGTRKASLQTCGLPMPDEKIEALVLAGSEEEFKANQKLAEERLAALQKKGVALNSNSPLRAKVWLPKEQWETVEALVLENLKGGDPLVTAPGKPSASPGPIVC